MKNDLNGAGIANGLTNYGDAEFSRYLRRSFAQSMGYSSEMLDRPIVGIANTVSGFNSCHRHFPDMLEAVKRGVLAAGGLPVDFPTISLGEVYLSPTSLLFRNLMAMDTEEMILGNPMDAVVLLGGCDKTVPAQIMGAVSADIPAVQVVAGPMSTGNFRGERLGACSDCRRFWGNYRSGEVSGDDIKQIESRLATTSGTCAVMGTASTMACIAETLGLMLPNTAAIPAVHAERLRASEDSGKLAVNLIGTQTTFQKLITPESIENALTALLAIGGSTNAVIHLAAIAKRAGHNLSLGQLNKISETTPVLVDLKPSGQHYMENFYEAGGMSAVLQELAPYLHLNCPTITGETLGDRIARERQIYINHKVVRKSEDPVSNVGGLVALFGTLAPAGAIIKRSAANPDLFETSGRAVVFSSLEDLAARIDDPDLDVLPSDILVLQNAGPKSASGMPEAGCFPIPAKLAKAGVKDIVRLSDARMSGTAFGTVVLHVSPEAAIGGPLALVENGDQISISVQNRTLDLFVEEDELAKRLENWKAKSKEGLVPKRGYRKLYHDHVQQAENGCDFDFC